MKDIFVEQFFILTNPVLDLSLVHTMTDFVLIHYLKIPLKNNMYTHTSLAVSSIIMPSWGASKNNLASVILQSTKKF